MLDQPSQGQPSGQFVPRDSHRGDSDATRLLADLALRPAPLPLAELHEATAAILTEATCARTSALLVPDGDALHVRLGGGTSRDLPGGAAREMRHAAHAARPGELLAATHAVMVARVLDVPPAVLSLIPLHTSGRLLLVAALVEPDATLMASIAPTVVTLGAILGTHEAKRETIAQSKSFDAFMSLMAHELRSPLTAIKGYAQLLQRQARRTPIPAPMERSIESIEEQAQRLAEMIDEVHDASRIRRGTLDLQPDRAELVGIVRAVAERRAQTTERHTLHVVTSESEIVGPWDPQRVRLIARALVDNAVRFSPEGGELAIALDRDARQARLTVSDSGVGIPAADMPHVFEYLYRSPAAERRNLSGLGLGLYLVRNVVERMGGGVHLHSSDTPGASGTTVTVTLPLAAPTANERAPHA